MTEGRHIAYLTGSYPRASDTFIRGEVEELRGLGYQVSPFSIRRSPESQWLSDAIRAEAARTTVLLSKAAVVPLMVSLLWATVTRPVPLWRALKLVCQTGHQGWKGVVWPCAYLLEACSLARQVRQRGIELIHNHIGGNSAIVAMLAAEVADVPFSQTIHGPHIFFAPEFWQLGQTIRRSAFTACITAFCRSQCMIFAPYDAWPKLKVVHCGIGRPFLEADSVSFPEEKTLVCVGRLCPEKGQLLLVEAMARLAEENIDVRLVLVGDGESRADIENLIRQYGLQARVDITGWCPSEKVKQHILASRALVLGSFAEGLPVVIMEALALGRPVIASRIAGVAELVDDPGNGWLVVPSSIDELTAAMREVVTSDVAELKAKGARGRQRVLADHHPTVEARKLQAHMEAVLAKW